jgi:hypothetical protein
MVDIEEDALRALEQDSAAAASRLVQVAPYRASEGKHEIGNLGKIVE